MSAELILPRYLTGSRPTTRCLQVETQLVTVAQDYLIYSLTAVIFPEIDYHEYENTKS